MKTGVLSPVLTGVEFSAGYRLFSEPSGESGESVNTPSFLFTVKIQFTEASRRA